MDFSKLSRIESFQDISETLHKASLFGGEVWQINHQGQRVFQIVHIEAMGELNQLVLKMGDFADINQEAPLFIRLNYRHLVFKLNGQDFKVIGNHIICHYPNEVFAVQKRDTDRYLLPIEQDTSLSIKRLERNFRDGAFEIEVRIIDVSETGFGILISGNNGDFFRPYDHFIISSIDHRPVSLHIDGTVLYVKPKSIYHRKPDVRVGLCLSRKLNYDLLQSLKMKSNLVLSA